MVGFIEELSLLKNMPERSDIRPIETEYFHISPNHPELRGDLVGEIANEPEGPGLHLAAPGRMRLVQHGRGDVVITGISRKGWEELTKVLDGLRNPTMDDIKRAITALDFIAWDKPSTGH